MDDDLGYEIKERAHREVQNALRPAIDEIVAAIRGLPVTQTIVERGVTMIAPPTLVRVRRPTLPKFAKMTVPDKNDWTRMVTFNRHVDTWSIHNLGTTDLYYAYNNNADDYNTLGADDFEAKDTVPMEIWVKRATSGNTVPVLIEWWEFEPEEAR